MHTQSMGVKIQVPSCAACNQTSKQVIRAVGSSFAKPSIVFPAVDYAPSNSLQSRFFCGSSKISRNKEISVKWNTRQTLVAVPKAIVATENAPIEMTKDFNLDGGSLLKVKTSALRNGSPGSVELEVTRCNATSLILHWGAIQDGKSKWFLPSSWPEGTKEYKKRALQSPFKKAGDSATLKIEINDPKFQAIEFLLKDDATDKWFKLNGGNFRVEVPKSITDISQIHIPEELIPVQAYLRWERNGKQNYSPDQEKKEYEEARKELQEEVAKGTSLEVIRSRLLGGKNDSGSHSEDSVRTDSSIPEELVQVQAYIRWERAGKPNFSAEEQLVEFEEARKELQAELSRGLTVKDLQKRLQSNEKQNNGKAVTKTSKPEVSSSTRITRKSRDLSDLIHKYSKVKAEVVASTREPTPLELVAQELEDANNDSVLLRKTFKLGDKELLALVSNPGGEVFLRLVSNMKEPLLLHWAVSKNNAGEWQAPPASIVPENSNVLQGSCETPFTEGFSGHSSLQSLEINFGKNEFIGTPFVLLTGGTWIKNNGSDFYLPLKRTEEKRPKHSLSDGSGTAKQLLEDIANMESEAERSLMHRYNIAANILDSAKHQGELGLAGILVWLRFMATRQLMWNKNYNVKPREISAAQDRLTDSLQALYLEQPHNRELIRLIMGTVGRGGQGDVGQRIRDEILVIQRNNDCKGAMMEEWHQKLHNNTSPDDVVICQALLDYIQSDFNIDIYWKTLNSNGVTKERLASYDRPIVSEPKFSPNQKEGLIRDLTAYLRTLKAVHSGADLESAIASCMGYSAQGFDFMGTVQIHPISGLSEALPKLLSFVLQHVEDREVTPLLEGLLEARRELHPTLQTSRDRLKDIIFLDLALDSTVRTAVERGLEGLNKAGPQELITIISLVLENLCLSSDNNEEFVYCLKDWVKILQLCKAGANQWALQAKSVLDRTRLALADKAEIYQTILQPSAKYLGTLLNVQTWAVDIFTEEMIRAGSAASLSLLLNRIDPVLRNIAHLGSWQVISPVPVRGYVVVVDDLGDVQDKVYENPTILVAGRVKGEEEIPGGAVAVLTPDMPDVLSHVSVRARNSKVCFATCFDSNVLSNLRSKEGKALRVEITASSDLVYSEINEAEVARSIHVGDDDLAPPNIVLKAKKFVGKYAVASDEFSKELVGAKSLNIANLKGKLPSWIRLPTSVALPFGVFESVLSENINKFMQDVASEISTLSNLVTKGDFSKLKDIRKAVLKVQAPPKLIEELKLKMIQSSMPWPGDESESRLEQACTSIKKVWASKWNERAYFSTRKARIDHNDLRMAVLVQEIICADYAFVIHTINPATGDRSEIYAEVVKGLGETLVGAYSGRALSFVCKKSDLNNPKITGYPSKRVGLFIKPSVIFRSDSNGEDLEGYAGAGLYDSVPMDREEERIVDYSSDPLVSDNSFQQKILSKISAAGAAIEELLGSAQDIEGVIRDGELYIVQTRPQM
ncbi:hypothetical protein O6H91_12G013500 [Diphasiastrum complanatum]|uniref:Uncharacterized protein n=1 Tax=Diphasiastrum complanatum TaxID=34168 RepID=A0ACC2BZH3_DIPCM|nr:hypothetical protein O6H91_12G013500 [Diphasiastrum complanatum]